MITGALTGFPINTILEFANRNIHGIGNIMTSTVRMSGEATYDQTASEHAISLMIANISGGSINYENIVGGTPFLDSVSALTNTYSYANYNTISVTGDYMSLNQTAGCISMSAYYDPDIYIFNPAGTTKAPIQGGKYQYFASFDSIADIGTGAGSIICHAQANDCIGKFFIRNTNGMFNTGENVKYSIGNATDNNKYVINFNAPTSIGQVDFEYNIIAFSGGFVQLDADEDIYIYRKNNPNHVPSPASNLGISIFYDKVEWNQSNGYFTRNSITDSIARFSMSNDVFQNLKLYPAYTAYEKTLCSIFNGTTLYAAGGRNTAGQPIANMESFDSSTTVNSVLRQSLTVARNGIGTFGNNTVGYFAGGSQTMGTSAFNNIGSQITEYYNFSTNTMSRSLGDINCYRYMPLSIGVDETNAYIYGGQAAIGTFNVTIEQYNMSTDISTVVTPNPMPAVDKMGAVPFKNTSYVYFGPAFTTDLAISNTMQKMNVATMAVANTSNFLTVPTAVSQTLYDNANAYICFGVAISHNDTYSIMSGMYAGRVEKMSFATEVTSVIEAWTAQNLGTSPAGSI
jgi:hypothetical protein